MKGEWAAPTDASEDIGGLEDKAKRGQCLEHRRTSNKVQPRTFQSDFGEWILFSSSRIRLRVFIILIELITLRIIAHRITLKDIASVSGVFDFLEPTSAVLFS